MKRHTDLGKLSDKQYQFQLELKNRFSLLEDMIENEPVDVMYEQVTSIIMEEAEKLAKGQKEKINTTSIYTEQIQKLNEKKKRSQTLRTDISKKPDRVYRNN